MTTLPFLIVIALILVNVRSFAMFGIDKARAREGQRRISEADLLAAALLGGLIGAYAGRSYFRHKTRKESFSMSLHVIAMIQVGIVAGLIWVFMLPG